MRHFNESSYYFDLHVEAKRTSLKSFINSCVDYFVQRNTIPTIEQVYDYISEDRWFKTHVYNDEFCTAMDPGYECLSIEDVCKNIQNMCSFNLNDIYDESYSMFQKLRIKE